MKTQTKIAWALFGAGAILMCGSIVLESCHGVGVAIVSCPLQEFSGDIPEYVLYKAIQIKKAFPDVELRLDYLTKWDWGSDSNSTILLNFFLVARYCSESYYVNFWDKIEATL